MTEIVDEHTQTKLEDYYETVETFHDVSEYRDPVTRRFFDSATEDPANIVEDFLFKRRRKDSLPEKMDAKNDKKITI